MSFAFKFSQYVYSYPLFRTIFKTEESLQLFFPPFSLLISICMQTEGNRVISTFLPFSYKRKTSFLPPFLVNCNSELYPTLEISEAGKIFKIFLQHRIYLIENKTIIPCLSSKNLQFKKKGHKNCFLHFRWCN